MKQTSGTKPPRGAKPSGPAKPSGAKGVLFAIAGAAVLAVAVYAGITFFGGSRQSHWDEAQATSGHEAPPPASSPDYQGRLTLDPNMFQGRVKDAYQIAEKRPTLLAQMHCYCGCDRTNNHKNLLDCFRDTHGSSCQICVGEALEADQLAAQGMLIDQIRDALRAHFAGKE